jgi:tRNA A-37 threonylcarbamoyl transferase component Bud32
VGMICIERELDDFELKQSAVRGVELLSKAGVLHNDIALRNIVQSRDDSTRAKIIDLGRAVFCKDKERLSEQIERIQFLLGVSVDQIATASSTS